MTAPSYASIDPKLQDHLDALGFHSVGSYRIWCHKQGLDKRLAKTDEQLVDEAALFPRLQAKAQPSPKKGHRPGTVRTLTKIYNGARGGWTHPEAMFDAAADQAERDALLRILVHLETYTGISWWVGARLAKHHAEWLRSVEEWYPHGENVELQVGALANHLLARYDAPLFMGRAWLDDGATARRCQSWFLHIARDGNIRSMDTEIHLTRCMAHAFPRAPDNLTIPMALRWAQCVGMGASRDLAHAIVRSRLRFHKGDENEPFWATVVLYLVGHPMLDLMHAGPIIAIRGSCRGDGWSGWADFSRGSAATRPGHEGPQHRQASAAGGGMAQRARRAADRELDRVDPCGINGFESVEQDDESGQALHWRIVELRDTRAMNREGSIMHHCIYSYKDRCAIGDAAVFSLQVGTDRATPSPVLTIALDHSQRLVTQYRGKCNMRRNETRFLPKKRELGKDYVRLLNRSEAIMKRWMAAEGLSLI